MKLIVFLSFLSNSRSTKIIVMIIRNRFNGRFLKKCFSENTLRESIEVLRGKKQKPDCIFEQ